MIDTYKGEYYDLFKSIFDDAENGICIVNYDGQIIELNSLYADMFGYEKEELIDQHFSILISEDYKSTVEQNHYKIFNGTNIIKADEKVIHKNGTYFYIQTSNLRVNDEQGNKLRITTAVDVTNRLKNELIQSVLLKISNLTNLNTPIDKIFKAVHEAVSQLFPVKNLTVCVKNRISGITEYPYYVSEVGQANSKQMEAEHKYILASGKSVALDNHAIEKLVKSSILKPYDPEPSAIMGIPLVVKNEIQGSLILKDYSKILYTKEDKELMELVSGQLARVIERKYYEEDLVTARNKAEEAVRVKSEFLAQISHEIRTPLNSILSFSSLLKSELKKHLSPDLEEAFSYIERGGNRLTRTIDLILNVSNSQNNQYKIKLEEVDLLNQILVPLVKEFNETANGKGIKLILCKSVGKIRLVCDQYSVNQLFSNLLENAIKYTQNGSVKIRGFQNEYGRPQVDVEDTGIGISDEYMPKIFDPFSQEEQGYTRTYEGIGLGLSLVKSYAELNNAEIKVQSKKDVGTTFSVIFN